MKRRKFHEKAMALVLVLIMVFAFAGSAMAANYTAARFDIATSSTTEFKTGCYDLKKKEQFMVTSLLLKALVIFHQHIVL